MANLSNINGKFVVEQTTGYVGVGTTDPNYPIEVLNASAEIALNASGGSTYRIQSDSASNFIIRKAGVGDRLVINSAGNATFAGNIFLPTASSYIKLGGYSYIGEDLTEQDSLTIASDSTESIYFAHYNQSTSAYTTTVQIDPSGNVMLDVNNWLQGHVTVGGGTQNLIRSRAMGYPGYYGCQIGQETNHIALFIDPNSVAGGAFSGNVNELMLPNKVIFQQANAVTNPTDWLNGQSITLDNGKVGIGTTSPDAKLEIDIGVDEVGLGVFTTGESTTPNVRFGRDDAQYIGFQIQDRTNTMVFRQDEGTGEHFADLDLWTSTNSNKYFRINNNDQSGNLISNWLTIKNGNVGIGTTNIGTQSNLYLGAFNSSEGGQLTLQKATGGTLAAHIDAYTTGGKDYMRILSGGDTSTTAAPFVFDLTNVRVGIGNTNPGAKLDVNQGSEDFVQRNYGPGNQQGIPQKITITKWYPVTSLGTKLLIPVISQGNLNNTTIVRMWGHSAVFNRASGYTNRSFTLDFTFGSLQLIYGLTTLNSTGNVSSVTQTSTTGGANGEIQVNFTNNYIQSQTGASYGGVYITLEYMTGSTNKSIIASGIALN